MSNRTVVRRVRRVSERQHGRITLEQLHAAGAGEAQLRHWIRTGWLTPEHRGVFVVGPRPRGREGVFCSALLACGPAAALSFEAAGGCWEVLRGGTRIEVTVPRSSGRTHRPGIRVHRADLTPAQITVHKGMRVTTLERTHVDLAPRLTPRRLSRMFQEAQVRHHLDPHSLGAEVVCRRGCRGTPALVRLLDGAVDPAGVRSVLELRFLELCDAYGIARPVVNEKLGPWRPDFLWPQAMVVVETDGWAFHRTAEARRRDAEKDAWLRAAGYVVVRLRWRDVVDRRAETAALVSAALAPAPRAAA